MSTEPRTPPAPGPAHKLTGKQRKAIVAGTIGNTVEWVDWALYSIFAKIIADEFFPPATKPSLSSPPWPSSPWASSCGPSARPSSASTPTATAARRA